MMQVMIRCDSLLLEKSLEIYLEEYLVSEDDADFYISDRVLNVDKPLFLIGTSLSADLKVPFTKEFLLLELKKFYLLQRENNLCQILI